MTKEMIRSSQPLLNPATSPMVIPIIVASTVETVAIKSEVAQP